MVQLAARKVYRWADISTTHVVAGKAPRKNRDEEDGWQYQEVKQWREEAEVATSGWIDGLQ